MSYNVLLVYRRGGIIRKEVQNKEKKMNER